MDVRNPYEAPLSSVQVVHPVERSERRHVLFFGVLWTFAFALNLIVPLLLGWSLVNDHGRLGMTIAASLLLAMGYCICASARTLRAPLVAGSFLLGLCQLLPVLQLVAGQVGLALARAVGGVSDPQNDWEMESISSELGGFVVTLVTGGLLIIPALFFGALLQTVTPSRWWNR